MTVAAPSIPSPRYPVGVAMVLTAGVCLSVGGLIVRFMEAADGWQIMFYRSTAAVVTFLVYLAVRYRGRLVEPFRAIGGRGLAVAALLGGGSICYVFALLSTTVANVVLILSATPLFTAALAWFTLGERVRARTWIAMSAAVLGIGLMVVDGVAAGRLLGSLLAFAVVASFAGMIVIIRRGKETDMVPATCLGAAVGSVAALFMADGLAVSTHDLALALFMGVGQFAAAFLLITIGTRYVPAAEVPLLALTETVLAPMWVWIFVGEVPSPLIFGGGGIVVAAVVSQAILGLRAQRAVQG